MKKWDLNKLRQFLAGFVPKEHRGVETRRKVPGSQLLRIHREIAGRARSRYPDATGKAR